MHENMYIYRIYLYEYITLSYVLNALDLIDVFCTLYHISTVIASALSGMAGGCGAGGGSEAQRCGCKTRKNGKKNEKKI